MTIFRVVRFLIQRWASSREVGNDPLSEAPFESMLLLLDMSPSESMLILLEIFMGAVWFLLASMVGVEQVHQNGSRQEKAAVSSNTNVIGTE